MFVFPAGSNGITAPIATISGSDTLLSSPQGIVLDSSGNLYVTDVGDGQCDGTQRVYVYPPLGSSTGLLNEAPSAVIYPYDEHGKPTLCYPMGIALDSRGDIYVADSGAWSVFVYPAGSNANASPSAIISSVYPTNSSETGPAAGIALDSSGNIYVTTLADDVQGLWAAGVFVLPAGSTGGVAPIAIISGPATGLDQPQGIAVDSSGNIYVADAAFFPENINGVAIYPPLGSSTGLLNEAPSATISGPETELDAPLSLALQPGDPPPTVTPTATATPASPTSVSVLASLSFGNLPVGDTLTKNLMVKNTGKTNPLFITGVTSSAPAEFAATGATTCPGSGLAPGLTCTIAIGFTPSTLGARSATISINDNTASSPQRVAAGGTGTVDMITTASVAIPNVKWGTTVTKSVKITNQQTNSVSLSIGFTSGPSDFALAGGGTCRGTLAGGTSCTQKFTFTPGALWTGSPPTESATLTVSDTPDALGPYHIPVTVAGTIPDTVGATAAVGTAVNRGRAVTANVLAVTDLAYPTFGIGALGVSIGAPYNGRSNTNAADFSIGSTPGTCPVGTAAKVTCYPVTFTATHGTPSAHVTESACIDVTVTSDPGTYANACAGGTNVPGVHTVKLTGVGK